MDLSLSLPSTQEELSKVRKLLPTDRDLFVDLLRDHFDDLKKKGVDTEVYTLCIDEYLNQTGNQMAIYGYFDEQELVSTVAYRFWRKLPYATLSYMISRKQRGLFNSQKNGLVFCLHKCLEESESLGIRAFYHLQRANTFRTKARTWRKFDTFMTKRYYSVPDLIIPAGQRPPYLIAWELMDKQTWPYNTILWVTRLKPEYEKMINLGKLSHP